MSRRHKTTSLPQNNFEQSRAPSSFQISQDHFHQFMIIDAHLHIWQADPDYPDQSATTVAPASAVPLELLKEYMAEHDVQRAVIVQPLYPGEDNHYIAQCAASDPERLAAVCVVDPRANDAVSRLKYWVEEKGCRGLRLRPRIAAEADCFGEPSTFPLWEYAEQSGVVINVLGGFEHLDTLARLAGRFNGVRVIVDHLAYPPIDDRTDFQPLLSLAKLPNIWVKVSGFPYFSQQGYPYADCDRLIRLVYESFGAERLIWGSDFPHILLQSGYARARNWLQRACDYLTTAEQSKIMGENALGLYWQTDLT